MHSWGDQKALFDVFTRDTRTEGPAPPKQPPGPNTFHCSIFPPPSTAHPQSESSSRAAISAAMQLLRSAS
jgi:hypothetical protein